MQLRIMHCANLCLLLCGCAPSGMEQITAEEPGNTVEVIQNVYVKEEKGEPMLQLAIENTNVTIDWEENPSVEALKDLCEGNPLQVQMEKFGSFEQFGPLGTTLASDDYEQKTSSGDVMLYCGNQIVIFYGNHSWSYTKLGHITEPDEAGLKQLLGNDPVTITISMEETK